MLMLMCGRNGVGDPNQEFPSSEYNKGKDVNFFRGMIWIVFMVILIWHEL